ncbi:hypothetical protein [Streptomyces sp. NPDC059928]|uniref:hypothetical protein n=1 Tax=unclassified Streptomyces TaxID=2593676 RepID=UPI00365A1058
MAQRLTAYETLVMPDYGGFDLYDGDCDAHDDDILIPRARAQAAAGNSYEILVVCAQSRIKVRLYIETWTAQPPLPDEWEGHCDLRMDFPTGQLVISECTTGAWGAKAVSVGGQVNESRTVGRRPLVREVGGVRGEVGLGCCRPWPRPASRCSPARAVPAGWLSWTSIAAEVMVGSRRRGRR